MTLKDETLLSAYLDGELELEQRSAVESALLDDAELACRLRQLTAMHELVAGLSRPVLPVDLSDVIDGRLDPYPAVIRFGFWPLLQARPRGAGRAAVGGLALAASLLLALGLSLRLQPPAQRPVPARGAPPAAVAVAPEPAGEDVADRTGASATEPAAPRRAHATPAQVAAGRIRRQHEAAAANQVRALLDSPRLHRIFIVTDIIGAGTAERVEELVQTTPRTRATYGRITVGQGIVIDPAHPKDATVFALVLNEQELRNFQKKLEQSFPERVEDAEADSVVVGQLADAGHMTVRPGTAASEVVFPRAVSPRVAYQSDSALQQPVETTRLASDFGGLDLEAAAGLGRGTNPATPAPRTRDEPGAPAGLADVRSGPGPGPPAPAGPSDAPGSLAESLRTINLDEPPQIVLVWVTSS